MNEPLLKRLVRIIAREQVLRSRDLQGHRIPRQYLRLALDRGLITRIARGLYVARGHEIAVAGGLAEACKRVPHGVICLLSALQFHQITTQSPFEIWMAIAVKARRPTVPHLPLRVVRFSGRALRSDVETRAINGVSVHVYSPAKTVADCFKYRNKIGLDVALEALRDCWQQRRATADDLWRAAKICRVANVMRPYMESLR
jgi:predicted transcriptional regulator of viral defense system